jgi:hypothetical protein
MVAKKSKVKARHPRTILKCYRMFLMGSDESESGIIPADILQKCKKFHACMLDGQTFYRVGKALNIPEHIAKRMRAMFDQSQAGDEITLGVSSRGSHPKIASAFALLLSGASDGEMVAEGIDESEIKRVKNFAQIINGDKLYAVISKEAKMPVSTVKKLRKMYRDSQADLCMETA